MRNQTFSRRAVILIFTALPLIGGCVTAQLPKDATPAERRAALCMDARTGMATAQAALSKVTISGDVRLYWEAFAAGAQIGIDTYCTEAK